MAMSKREREMAAELAQLRAQAAASTSAAPPTQSPPSPGHKVAADLDTSEGAVASRLASVKEIAVKALTLNVAGEWARLFSTFAQLYRGGAVPEAEIIRGADAIWGALPQHAGVAYDSTNKTHNVRISEYRDIVAAGPVIPQIQEAYTTAQQKPAAIDKIKKMARSYRAGEDVPSIVAAFVAKEKEAAAAKAQETPAEAAGKLLRKVVLNNKLSMTFRADLLAVCQKHGITVPDVA